MFEISFNNSINKNALPAEINKYLYKFCLPGWGLELAGKSKYELIIVVPVIDEYENIKRLITSLSKNDKRYLSKTLLLFVVNNTEGSPEKVKQNNLITLEYLKKQLNKQSRGVLNIGIINASVGGKELPKKEGGVGLARKIGMDLSLLAFDYKSKKKKIIGCLDADCSVSKDYVKEIIDSFNNKKMKAAYVKYEHPFPREKEYKKAIICYEIFLRYYILGLKYAGSPYSIQTIGSTMFCDSESYVKVQGMNKRKAAEDFYFMEKLAKITEISRIEKAVVYPSGRSSWRVPFGTGQRVSRFISGERDEYRLYEPETFLILKNWLDVFMSSGNVSPMEYLYKAREINAGLGDFLMKNKFEEQWKNILENCKTAEQLYKQKKLWFDGFKTLKLIHYLRDNGFPPASMFDALDKMFVFTKTDFRINRNGICIPELTDQIKYLETLREIT